MDKAGGNQGGKVLKKGKKKHAKDELDRQKQAEKKRRRLEKALANSAAIISELEKNRQQKREEQQRLDDEGAAIAEAVALHVLIDEDSEEPCHLMLNNLRICNHWEDFVGFGFAPDSQGVDAYPSGKPTSVSHAYVPQLRWTNWGMSQTFLSRSTCSVRYPPWPYSHCLTIAEEEGGSIYHPRRSSSSSIFSH